MSVAAALSSLLSLLSFNHLYFHLTLRSIEITPPLLSIAYQPQMDFHNSLHSTHLFPYSLHPYSKQGRKWPPSLFQHDYNDYRLVDLVSHVMTICGSVPLEDSTKWLSGSAACLHTNQSGGCNIFLIHLTHLEMRGDIVRIMSFDISSAFSTIQPCLWQDMFHCNCTLTLHPGSWSTSL